MTYTSFKKEKKLLPLFP